jgi:hypothetical protein
VPVDIILLHFAGDIHRPTVLISSDGSPTASTTSSATSMAAFAPAFASFVQSPSAQAAVAIHQF